ncbi:MAG: tRNA 2-selenouridine(34) synthase MnmH [Halieaceae bacterium]|jgi:tRNA 2-selenouridine synthase|nr:tRNA 2-selenouridine(34) synthase MnmH [Halieaceae bacterium]
MPERPDTANYRALFLNDVPMMDMRAPAEFIHGAFPGAHSLPLMTDEERARVGICYKQRGQAAAIELGHQLVAAEVKAQRLALWSEFARRHPDGYLYCFRGGLRSLTVQQWLREAGIDYPLVRGGYKAMRRFLLEELARSLARADIVLVSGKTGTGKTRVINRLERSVDLEGLARHRGSTFGQLPQPQPSQIDFENALSIALMKLLAGHEARVYLEDEGRMIGRVSLPEALRERMAVSPMAVVEQGLAERVEVIVEDYVLDLGRRFAAVYGESGFARHREKLQDDLGRIRKRLGGERYQWVSDRMADAFLAQDESGDLALHREWIAALLEQYYDPMYEYQLAQRGGQIVFRGSRDEVVAWATGGD